MTRGNWLTRLTISALCIALALVVVIVLRQVLAVGSFQLSVHGYIALIGGALLTLAVGGGLMALLFLSARRGHDDLIVPPEGRTRRHDDGQEREGE